MKPFVMKIWFWVVLGFALVVTGCASHYYKVTEPQSGNVYYTREIDNLKGGAVKLMDARTGSLITIQNSEVKEISSQEYKAWLAAPISKPTPAAPPAPAAVPMVNPAQNPSSSPAPPATGTPSSAPSGPK